MPNRESGHKRRELADANDIYTGRSNEFLESEERFRTLFAESPNAYMLIGMDGRFVDGNHAMERQIGYTCEDLAGTTIFESPIFPPVARERAKKRMEMLQRGEHLGPVEYSLVRKDGSEITVEVTTMLVHIGGELVLLCSSRDLTARKQADAERELLDRQRQLALDAARMGWWHYDPNTQLFSCDLRYTEIFGISGDERSLDEILKLLHPDDRSRIREKIEAAFDSLNPQPFHAEYRVIRPDGEMRWIETHGLAVLEGEGKECHAADFIGTVADITERKQLRDALEKRVLALTQPFSQMEDISFDDLFDRKQLQLLQDQFSDATGVASIIAHPDGTPITRPSNFTDLCERIIRNTEKGCANCYKSDAIIGRHHPEGPVVQPCLSGGLWDAGASIEVGGVHIANWLIGQVRDETQTDEQMLSYARQIGADEKEFLEAFHRVPVMSREQFEKVALVLFTLANQISTSAYQNVQQARFIEAQKKAEEALRESEQRYRRLFQTESDAIIIFDGESLRIIEVNDAAVKLYGYTHEEFTRIPQSQISAEPEKSDAAFRRVLSGEDKDILCGLHRKKDGTVFPVEISGSSFVWEGRSLVCGVIRDISERVAREKEIQKNRKDLRQLASELSLTNQRERRSIAGELHDSLSQLLSSAFLRLDALKLGVLPEKAAGSVEKVCDIIQQALQQVRSLTFHLSCPMLDELGLAAALEELCLSMSHEYAFKFEFKGDKEPLPLSLDRKMVLYRSAREMLINVIKHSEAHSARMRLERSADFVHICVSDDGKGFDTAMAGLSFSPDGGFGLFNIHEYVQHVGGELSIESKLGEGTQVLLSIPLQEV